MKRCSKCKTDKPLEDFSRAAKNKDGRKSYCRACSSAYFKEWRARNLEKELEKSRRYRRENYERDKPVRDAWRAKNRERLKEYDRIKSKEYREKNREALKAKRFDYYKNNYERIMEYRRNNPHVKKKSDKKYYAKNRERILEGRREYNEKNAERNRQRVAKWAKENPDRVREQSREYAHRRRARIMRVNIDMPTNYWSILLETYGARCMNPDCLGSDPKLTHDHVIPLAKGGEHSLANSQILCNTCNIAKGVKTIDYRSTE